MSQNRFHYFMFTNTCDIYHLSALSMILPPQHDLILPPNIDIAPQG